MRSLSRTLIGFGCSLALASIASVGCSPPVAVATKKPQSGSAQPETKNLKEQMEEKWLEEATKGLSFTADSVVPVTKRVADRSAAIAKTTAADKSLNTENIWFKAAGMFRDAIVLDPSYAPAYEGLGRSLLMEGNLDMVEAALKTAIRLDPNQDKARFEYGMIVQMRGDFTGCVKVWKELVDRNPAYPDAYARMSVASYFAHDYDAAYAYLAEADKRKQNVPSQFRPLLKEAAPRP